jgi:AcrR family transcriptional regulator
VDGIRFGLLDVLERSLYYVPMARPRLHDDDDVLDAAAAVTLELGARGASIDAIAARSGAPVGSIYHRFGSRDGVLAAAWERAVRRFQAGYLPDEVPGPDALATAAGMAEAVVGFATSDPDGARLLMTLRPEDHFDTPASMEELNVGIVTAVRSLARALGVGGERVRMAVIDLPYGTMRRRLAEGRPIDAKVRAEVGDAARALLAGDGAPAQLQRDQPRQPGGAAR